MEFHIMLSWLEYITLDNIHPANSAKIEISFTMWKQYSIMKLLHYYAFFFGIIVTY